MNPGAGHEVTSRRFALARGAARFVTKTLRLSPDHEERIYKFIRNPLTIVGVLFVATWVVAGALAPFVAPHPQDALGAVNMTQRFRPPDAHHLFGTDYLGRDVLSRMLFGARITLIGGTIPILVAMLVGSILGALAGYFGGIVDRIIMRTADVFLALPPLVLAIAITSALSPSLFNVMMAISLVLWPWYARLTHAQAIALKEEDFVLAARGIGASSVLIVATHILPNCLSAIIVKGATDLGFGILTLAGLGFIGMGAQPPSPEWGLDISVNSRFMTLAWWSAFFPGMAIFTAVLGFNLIGDGLRDALDPEQTQGD